MQLETPGLIGLQSCFPFPPRPPMFRYGATCALRFVALVDEDSPSAYLHVRGVAPRQATNHRSPGQGNI
jgi:hypothetical protein